MFSRARWRLTIWFAVALALILAVIGSSVYITARSALFRQVDDDLRARTGRDVRPVAIALLEGAHRGWPPLDAPMAPAFTTGGHFYALVTPDGSILASTPNIDAKSLAAPTVLQKAIEDGPTFTDTQSSDGDHLRVYVLPLRGSSGADYLVQVGRSTEPERRALGRLLFILGGGGAAGLFLAFAGGFLLAGRALRPIQTAMDRQRTFVADASHELRTPLSLIRANAEVLKRHATKGMSANMESVDDIIQETDRLNGLVAQMLTLARADSGQAALSLSDVDLSELTADTARQMKALAEPKGIAIEVAADEPLHLRGDVARLRQLLMILLDNSIKYSDPGASVKVLVQPSNGKVQLQVSDTGCGIPPEALSRIFDRFYRVDKARSREMGGTGLGLAIAKWIVDSHRGTIRVESKPEMGTTVSVELPGV